MLFGRVGFVRHAGFLLRNYSQQVPLPLLAIDFACVLHINGLSGLFLLFPRVGLWCLGWVLRAFDQIARAKNHSLLNLVNQQDLL